MQSCTSLWDHVNCLNFCLWTPWENRHHQVTWLPTPPEDLGPQLSERQSYSFISILSFGAANHVVSPNQNEGVVSQMGLCRDRAPKEVWAGLHRVQLSAQSWGGAPARPAHLQPLTRATLSCKTYPQLNNKKIPCWYGSLLLLLQLLELRKKHRTVITL